MFPIKLKVVPYQIYPLINRLLEGVHATVFCLQVCGRISRIYWGVANI